ncbi:hypothetical protein IV38_GL002069 [Lactobacillus selangorensis]|uniref:DUF2508 domain-containing protein n=1 Tax=Lactobacillus selangorensis TaxID=81857 RepID=A0A0R2G1Y2_9LACO|nr:YaaL family protein [Lactobacillus selangorensis]KRN27417.1 hypothetical protein IV38_GL002069 [Lactobacillus selangorensis]KRN31386.1 hypothetical protein IV40_GL001381 [Lactobacillus selangorensis]
MFGRHKQKRQVNDDQQLIDLIYRVREQWHQAKRVEENAIQVDNALEMQTALQKNKYQFLYREARRRKADPTLVSNERIKYQTEIAKQAD